MTRILPVLLLIAALLGIATASADTPLSFRQEGNIIIVSGWLQPNVEPSAAWDILTDYEHFPEFVPGIRLNRIVTADDRFKIVEQQGELMAGSLRVPYGGTMRITEIPQHELHILFLNGLFKDVEGTWLVGKKRPVKLSYELRMDLMKSPYPPSMANLIAEQQVKLWVSVFAAEMERRQNKKRGRP